LSDVHFPDAAKIVLVQDNLNTHKPASLYEAFLAAEARRLVEDHRRGRPTDLKLLHWGAVGPAPDGATRG
jgi:hypothetical protein